MGKIFCIFFTEQCYVPEQIMFNHSKIKMLCQSTELNTLMMKLYLTMIEGSHFSFLLYILENYCIRVYIRKS